MAWQSLSGMGGNGNGNGNGNGGNGGDASQQANQPQGTEYTLQGTCGFFYCWENMRQMGEWTDDMGALEGWRSSIISALV
jgi:hypothetical protein